MGFLPEPDMQESPEMGAVMRERSTKFPEYNPDWYRRWYRKNRKRKLQAVKDYQLRVGIVRRHRKT